MFLDASVVVAILAEEEDGRALRAKLEAAPGPFYFSPIVRYEATIALARISQSLKGVRLDEAGLAKAETVFDFFMATISATEIDISSEIGRAALRATRTYGKIVGHKAALNFGDCFSYAAAKALGVGLLYKGNDFAQTDLA
jgi:ribonuclease VapC